MDGSDLGLCDTASHGDAPTSALEDGRRACGRGDGFVHTCPGSRAATWTTPTGSSTNGAATGSATERHGTRTAGACDRRFAVSQICYVAEGQTRAGPQALLSVSSAAIRDQVWSFATSLDVLMSHISFLELYFFGTNRVVS
ncbi:hypothetical protein Zm00014a_019627 [Zea mays]|uniref:Uncharacterized protein n=1 Tax=Zea mays TaxID=4577 RepID=A0A3L6EPP4_MAIZE|nr:hypothetical protein Zm00014a_019627 [Zea mays]